MKLQLTIIVCILFTLSIEVLANNINTKFPIHIPRDQKLVLRYSYVPPNTEHQQYAPILPEDSILLTLQLEDGREKTYTIQLCPSSIVDNTFIGPQQATEYELSWYPAQIGAITNITVHTPNSVLFPPSVLQVSVVIMQDEREYAQRYVLPTASIEDILQWNTRDGYRYHDDFLMFRWQSYPDVIVFAFQDRDIQELYLKRLAFFVEKKGTRGTVVHLKDVAHRRGWGANDFKMEDIVQFFNRIHVSQKSESPIQLTEQEETLRSILLETKMMISTNSSINQDDIFTLNPQVPHGAIVSYAKSDPSFLQKTLLFHELLHTLYFRDQSLREKVNTTWDSLHATHQQIMKNFLDTNGYDVSFEYLVKNEYFAYLLQRKISMLDNYIDIRIIPEAKIRISRNIRNTFKHALITHAQQLSLYTTDRYKVYDGDMRYIREIINQ